DLRARRSDLHGLGHRAAGEGEVSGVELELLDIRQGFLLLDAPAIAAEGIDRVADRRPEAEEIDDRPLLVAADRGEAHALAAGARREIDLRKERTAGLRDPLLRLRQGCDGRGQR